jgi:hypothetical protein
LPAMGVTHQMLPDSSSCVCNPQLL